MHSMFDGCSSLEVLNLSGVALCDVYEDTYTMEFLDVGIDNMLDGCTSLLGLALLATMVVVLNKKKMFSK